MHHPRREGGGGEGGAGGLPCPKSSPSPCGRSDAIEAAALAAALAESALESESEEHKTGPWECTPSHLYGFNGLCDPDFGSGDDLDNSTTARGRERLSWRVRVSRSSLSYFVCF
jgi:hypothetical protein